MYIQRNKVKSKTGKEYSSVLLCSKYREGGKIKTRVEANLSKLPGHIILGIENMLKSERETTLCLKDITVKRCIDYGYVHVLLHMLHTLRIDEVLEKVLASEDARLVKAMIMGKIMTGGSKLCTYNWLVRESAICELLHIDISDYKVDRLYHSLGQIHQHQAKIEKKWFRYHKGSQRRIYLYDITSAYFEGVQNELAAFGYNRDGKKGKMQMCVGLLTTEDGFPLRIQAFKGNTSDSSTVSDQLLDLKKEFGVEQLVFVGDRGMQIMYHLENDPELSEENIDFITGLTHAQIQTLIDRGAIELNLFNRDLAEVTVDKLRYILSVNPELEARELFYMDRRRERADALVENIRKSWTKRCVRNGENRRRQQEDAKKYKHLKTALTLKDMDGYKRRVALALKESDMSKYYTVEVIDNETFRIDFNEDEFARNRSLCGKYVVCTSVLAREMNAEQVRGQYKNLQYVEHAFRELKSDNISIRPVFHRREPQTRGHVQLCMFAYAIIKEMENRLFPLLKTYNKNQKQQLSFNDLIAELNNIKICELQIGHGLTAIQKPELNSLQKKILEALNIEPEKIIKQIGKKSG
jgi:transposase